MSLKIQKVPFFCRETVLVICMAAIFKPFELEMIDVLFTPSFWQALDNILVALNFGIMFAAVILFLSNRYIPSRIFWLLICLFLIFLVSALVNNNITVLVVNSVGPTANFCFLADHCRRNGRFHIFLKSVAILLFVWLAINLATFFIFPGGMYGIARGGGYSRFYWFLGWGRRIYMYGFPGLLSVILYSNFKNNQILTPWVFTYIAIFGITAILVNAVGVMVILSLSLILLFFQKSRFISKMLNPSFLIFICYFWFFGIVIFRVQNLFEFFIVDVLGRDLTFSGRTFWWDEAIYLFLTSPFFGVGFHHFNLVSAAGQIIGGYTLSSHSLYMDILLVGGFFAFLVLLTMHLMFIRDIRPYRDTVSAKILCVFMFVISFHSVSEGGFTPLFFVPLIYAQHNSALEHESREFQLNHFDNVVLSSSA